MKSLPLKILLGAALLIALVFAAAPKIIGLNIEDATINNLVQLIPPEVETQVEIRRTEFSAGWFSSEAELELAFTPGGQDEIQLILNFDIAHGPLLRTPDGLLLGLAYADIRPHIDNDEFQAAIADLESQLPELSIDLLARFDQSLRLTVGLSEIDYSGDEGTVVFGGLQSIAEIAADQSAHFTMEVGEVSATEVAEDSNITLAGISLDSSTARMNDILAASSATLLIPSVSSTSPTPFNVTDIRITWGMQAAADNVSSEIYQTLSIGNLESAVPLNALSWNSEIKQLNNELLQDYYQLLNEIQRAYNVNPDSISTELAELSGELLLLAMQNPLEFNNVLEFSAYGGEHSAELMMLWSGQSGLTSLSSVDIGSAIASLNLTLSISLNLEAVLRSPLAGLIDPYVQQGYLTVDNGRVLIEASLENSVLRVNGDQLPIDQFF